MKQKIKQNYELLAQHSSLKLDEENGILYGTRNGFDVMVYSLDDSHPYVFQIEISANRPGAQLTADDWKAFKKQHKPMGNTSQEGNRILSHVSFSNNQEKLRGNLEYALNALTGYLQTNGYVNCCNICGKAVETDKYLIGGGTQHLCPDCFQHLKQNAKMNHSQKNARRENLIAGIVGALLGTLLGVACIVILGQLGYVASVSGVVMAVCTLKGYELLGGKLTTKGIVISSILMIAMTYVGYRFDIAIAVMRELNWDIVSAYRSVPILLQEDILDVSSYWMNLFMVYAFVLLGFVPTIHGTMKNQRTENRVVRIGSGQ